MDGLDAKEKTAPTVTAPVLGLVEHHSSVFLLAFNMQKTHHTGRKKYECPWGDRPSF